MNLSRQNHEKVLISVISVCFLVWSGFFIYRSSFIGVDGHRYFCLFDDAMISMRYAWNFSHGFGLVWNPGEYIQGYTNLLMTLLMSFATWIFNNKTNAVLFIQIFGVALILAIAFVSMKIADTVVSDQNKQYQQFVRVFTFFCTLSYYPLLYWTLMGMETGLLTLLLLISILCILDYTRSYNSIKLILASLCMGMAFLTRIDSVVFSFLIFTYVVFETFYMKPKNNQKILWPLLGSIIVYFLFIIGQLAFQYFYYGEVFPNTYTLKLTGMPLFERIINGMGFITLFLIMNAFFWVMPAIDLVINFKKQKLLLLSIAFSAIVYQIYVGGDPWPYWRITSPIVPLLIILFINGFINSRPSKRSILQHSLSSKQNITQVVVVSFTLIGLIMANIIFLPEIFLVKKPYTSEANQTNVNIAIALNQLTTSDATIGVYWAGSIPYFTDLRAIDFLGKSDRYIAHLQPDISGSVGWNGMKSVPGHNKYDLNYSIKYLRPTYVQNIVYGAQNLSEWAETKYIKVDYEGVGLLLLKDSPYVLWRKVNMK